VRMRVSSFLLFFFFPFVWRRPIITCYSLRVHLIIAVLKALISCCWEEENRDGGKLRRKDDDDDDDGDDDDEDVDDDDDDDNDDDDDDDIYLILLENIGRQTATRIHDQNLNTL